MPGEDPDILFDCAELHRGAGLAALRAAVQFLQAAALQIPASNRSFQPTHLL